MKIIYDLGRRRKSNTENGNLHFSRNLKLTLMHFATYFFNLLKLLLIACINQNIFTSSLTIAKLY